MPDAEPRPRALWGAPSPLILLVTLAALSGMACTATDAMTPDRAQSTVTAYTAQSSATAAARATSELAVAASTAGARSSATTAAHNTVTAVAIATSTTEAIATATSVAGVTATSVAGVTATTTARMAATATKLAEPTATNTPVPTITPTPGPRFPAAVGGQGEIIIGAGAASFGFGVGKRDDGKVEGWLQYGGPRGALRGMQFTKLDTYLGTAGFWGNGTLPDVSDAVTFNVNLVSSGQAGGPGSFHIVVFGSNGRQLFAEGGPVARGSINVSGP